MTRSVHFSNDTDLSRVKAGRSVIRKKKVEFKRGDVVISPWNRLGSVDGIYKDESGTVTVSVQYYHKDLPDYWDIGGQKVKAKSPEIDMMSIITIGHNISQLKKYMGFYHRVLEP